MPTLPHAVPTRPNLWQPAQFSRLAAVNKDAMLIPVHHQVALCIEEIEPNVRAAHTVN